MISRYSSVFLILAAALIGCILFFSLTEKGHSQLRKMVIHLPFFREIPVAMDYSHLTQGLSLGLRSGLSPETSLELTKDLISQPVILERLRKASSILDSGETFSKALTESGLFGGMEGRLITISFYSGSSDETFRRLSRQYTERSIDLISQAVSIVEPTIVILLSLLVGLVLLSVICRFWGSSQILQCKVVTAWNFLKAAEQNFSEHFFFSFRRCFWFYPAPCLWQVSAAPPTRPYTKNRMLWNRH